MNGSVEYIKEKSQKIELTDKRTALTFLERENDTLQSLSFEWMKFFFPLQFWNGCSEKIFAKNKIK